MGGEAGGGEAGGGEAGGGSSGGNAAPDNAIPATPNQPLGRGNHKYYGKKAKDILKEKKGSIMTAPLEKGAPSWQQVREETWEDIVRKAEADKPGYRTIKKLLTDKRFDK